MIQAAHPDAAEQLPVRPDDFCTKSRLDEPARDWTLWELYDRALYENEQIGQHRRCAPNYWYFGTAMRFVQAQVPEGRWMAWCREHNIKPDRWKRGRHLALAFGSATAIDGMTIEEAEALACEILGQAPRRSSADAKLRRSLRAMEKTVQNLLVGFDRVTRPDGLRPRIAELIRQFTALEHCCAALEKNQAAPVRKRCNKPR